MKRLSLKVACAFIVAAGTVVAWQRDAHAIDALIACGIAYNVCVDRCDRTYTAPGEVHTCGTICGNDFWVCLGFTGPAPELPGNYAD